MENNTLSLSLAMEVSECVGFNVLDVIGHFGEESFQAVDCTGTDNQAITQRKYTS